VLLRGLARHLLRRHVEGGRRERPASAVAQPKSR
jgi:hypothetical protein